MVATVGSISIDLSTNTVKFANGFKSAATTVERESGRMKKAVGGFATASKAAGGLMQGFIGGIAGGAAFAALGSLSGALGKARQALSDFEEIGIRAKTAGLDTDFFQGLSFGAKQADVETETLNKSLAIFAKNVGLAREGTGGLYSGLLQLNPELLRAVLTAGNQEQRLKLVAEAMSRMTDETQKAALASIVFGKGGLEMIRVLDGGAAALDKMQQAADEMGIIIPQDMIERAAALDDKLTVLADVIDIQLSQALVNAAPLLVQAAEGAAKFAKDINQLSKDITAFASNPSLDTFDNLFNVTLRQGSIADRIRDWVTGTQTAVEEVKSLEAELLAAQKHLADLIAMGAGFEDFVKPAIDNVVRLQKAIVGVQDQMRRAELASQFRASENASMAALEKMRGEDSRVPPSVKAEIDDDVLDKIEAAIDEETGATRDVTERIGLLDSNIGGYIGSLGDGLDRSFDAVSTELGVLTRSYRDAMRLNAEGFKFSGLGGGIDGSSGGRTGGTYTLDSGRSMESLPDYWRTQEQPIAETDGAGASIKVSVVVKPVLEGTRLSSQSIAELKQAASAGTEAALRAYHGR